MAHTCPDCGCSCHCRGDIDDIDFGEAMDCTCCLFDDEFEDDGPYDFIEDYGEVGPQPAPNGGLGA